MNGAEFFVEHFGRHFIEPSGDAIRDAGKVLTKAHPQPMGKTSRFTTGNAAVIRTTGALMRGHFAVPGITCTEDPTSTLFLRVLEQWSGDPLMLVTFEKVLFPPSHLLVSYDVRRIRICDAKGVTDVNWLDVINADAETEALNEWERRLRAVRKKQQRLKEVADA